MTYQIDLQALAVGDPDHLQRFYLSWVNEFMTSESMAKYYGLKLESVIRFIDQGRVIHERRLTKKE
jgi:hypothetical protein